VASMAFGEVVPAVDGNVRRVLARLLDLANPGAVELRNLAAALVDPARPGDFNQGMMELGSTVCLPHAPRCASCPLQDVCLARSRGTVAERPTKRTRRPVPEVEVAVVAAWVPTPRFLLRKRPGGGLLARMWEFPGAEVEAGRTAGDVALELAGELGLDLMGEPVELDVVTHRFSHLKARYRPFAARVTGMTGSEAGRWLREEDLAELPLPVAQRKIAEAVKYVVQNRLRGL
jgi:A/G-specific adenine glycosylase